MRRDPRDKSFTRNRVGRQSIVVVSSSSGGSTCTAVMSVATCYVPLVDGTGRLEFGKPKSLLYNCVSELNDQKK